MTLKKRTLSREFAFKFLFQHNDTSSLESLNEDIQDFIPSFIESDPEHPQNTLDEMDYKFAYGLIENALKNYQDLKEKLNLSVKNFGTKKVDHITQTLLLLATTELLFESTPHQVIINETLNISKKYGNKDSYVFINGALEFILKHNMRPSTKL